MTKRKLRVTDKKVRKLLGTYDKQNLKWDPQGFALESSRLEQRIIEASVQTESLERFETNPRLPMTYIVAGNPDDTDARYFAGYLAQLHMNAMGMNADVIWSPIIGTFDNPIVKQEAVTMIVLMNLTPRSSNLKFEKVRDIIEAHPKIPKVIVVAGEDPMSFAATRLHVPCHGIAYFGSAVSNTFNGVI